MTKFKEVVVQHRSQLADLLLKETGKPQELALFEVNVALDYFDHHIGLNIEEEKQEIPGKIFTTRYVPLGTVAAICPWNFPVVLALGKILPALIAGNCAIVKP